MLNNAKKMILLFFLVSLLPSEVLAQIPTSQTVAKKTGPLGRLIELIKGWGPFNPATNDGTFTTFIGQIISVFLSILGVVFIFLMIYAGYNWMTAAGNMEKVEKAQHTIKVAIIGLIIIASSFAIWQFIFIRLLSR